MCMNSKRRQRHIVAAAHSVLRQARRNRQSTPKLQPRITDAIMEHADGTVNSSLARQRKLDKDIVGEAKRG